MSDLPLFYQSIEMLNSETHRGHRVRAAARPFGYAEKAQLIPAVVDEFAAAAREIPIVFAPNGQSWTTVFLCGLRSGSNLFVGADGRWNGEYVPAYLRRYPFIMGDREGADPVVCIDARFEGFGAGEAGERLFDDEGKATALLETSIRLVVDFAAAARRTEDFAALLSAHGLLKTVTIDVQAPGGDKTATIHGLAIIDEAKLNALPTEIFEELRANGLLGPVYAHLFSIGATRSLANRLQAADAAPAAADAEPVG